MMAGEVADLQALYEGAPCAYVVTDLSGTLVQVNGTFERLSGYRREELVGQMHLAELFSRGGRIYYETHYAPLLLMQGSVQAIALELRGADGVAVPVLINSVVHRDADSYESELLAAQGRERDIAHYLQRSMLSGHLPTDPGFELAFRYDPAEDALEIGGDWYDAFWLGEGSIGLVVGDVVGRGIQAAAEMGQLRSAVRALASTGLSPGELLNALDTYSRRYAVGETATLVYAQLDVSTGELRFACAGHPPPVLLDAAGEARLLWEGRSRPLRAGQRAHTRPEAHCRLGAGTTLLLYTDGLIEDRARPNEDGLDRLVALVDGRPREPLDTLVKTLVDALVPGPLADDVCVLATRLSA
jgi:PAS domain S-box-containing protein